MSTEKKCDKCRKEIDEKKLNMVGIFHGKVDNIDLCDVCSEKIQLWLREN